MLALALPLVLAELGWMAMALVDTVMVGHLPLSSEALSASALAQILYNTVAFGFGGVLLALDTTLSQAHGAGDTPAANRWLWQGLLLALALTALLTGIFAVSPHLLRLLHTEPAVIAVAVPTLRALSFGTLPLLVYFALRRYVQAFNHVRVITWTLVTANIVNAALDWLLIFDHHWRHAGHGFGWHGLGVVGSGLSTACARLYQAGFLIAAIALLSRRHGYALGRHWTLRPDWPRLRHLVALGAPAGGTILVEIAVFCVVTAAVASLGAIALAGHEIAINCVSFTFMIPMGISAAAGIRVGQAIGRGSAEEAKAAGWAAILLSLAVSAGTSAVFFLLPAPVAGIFTRDPAVIAAAVPLLVIAAFFQFCDGLQVTIIGALRGAGDTASGLLTHLCTYWLCGLPLGLWLCFRRGLGARGLWLGLSTALILAGLILTLRWRAKQMLPDAVQAWN